jgi:hypothetical protein
MNRIGRKQPILSLLQMGFPVAVTLLAIVTLTIAPLPISPASAQSTAIPRVRTDGVWRQIYQRLPDLPLENQYVNKESGKVDPDNTLVGRLIRYHVYVKGRPPFYRLDWKMTLADYLEINEVMDEAIYPSSDTLRKNPTAGDVAAIKKLNRAQRDALIQALVDAFTYRPQ